MNRTEENAGAGQAGPRGIGSDSGSGFWVRPVVCTVAGLVGNTLLSGGKLFIGFWAGSAALVADGYHSLADVLSDIGILLALKAASTPPDEDHPYGHHSFETLGAILVAAFMLATAGLIGKSAISDLVNRDFLKPDVIALWASLGSVLVKEVMARYTLLVGRMHGSPALMANGAMHRSDAISSLAAAAGISGALLGWTYLDNIGALVIAPLGFFMGMPFPKAALRVGTLIDWGFAVNGAASVLGATLILLVVFAWGFTAALLIAVALYLVAGLMLSWKSAW